MKLIFRRFANKIIPPRNVQGRRRGIAFVFLGLTLLVLGGVTGLVVDLGHLHTKEAQAARAADAAALAGALTLADNPDAQAAADTNADQYAKQNGYDPEAAGVVIRKGIDAKNPKWYTVYVSKPEPLFFMRFLLLRATQEVGASATAQFTNSVPADLSIGGDYGVSSGPINYSIFGPQSLYENGDPYSPRWTDDKGTLNADHIGFGGYNFKLQVLDDYKARNNGSGIVNVEIFDPDTWNKGTDGPDGIIDFDEIRSPYNNPNQQPVSNFTQTLYSLYKVDPKGDILIKDATYRDDPSTNGQWVTPDGFTFDIATYGTGEYRINVQTLDGSSENGFKLRAGPPAPGQEFNAENGTSITATGQIPINFNQNGESKITLGQVPAEAKNGELIIEKFDTDIQATEVFYTSDPKLINQPERGWPGILSANGQWQKDNPIPLPADYEGATWYASYFAGRQDTSLWKLSYIGRGQPGSVKLVGRSGQHY